MNIDSDDQLFYSSVILEYIVSKENDTAFNRWYGAVTQLAEQQPGFLRMDRCPPLECIDNVTKYYSIIHFDTPQHLDHWLTSKAQADLLESGKYTFVDHKFKSFTTGLEGWFSRQVSAPTLGPSRWKQVLSVVLGLYPLVMLQALLFPAIGFLASWPPSAAMLVNNLITAAILTYGVMPQVSRLFGFWLYPAHRDAPRQINLLGTAVLLSAMGMMVILFNQVQLWLGR